MRKSTVTRTWLGGLVLLAVGLLAAGVSIGLMLAYGGTFTKAATGNTYAFVPSYDNVFWTTTGIMIAGFAAAAIGGLVQLVAWIGALVNTYQLRDKTWFAVVLAGGLLGLAFGLIGFAAMVAYLIAGPMEWPPDSHLRYRRRRVPQPSPQPADFWTRSRATQRPHRLPFLYPCARPPDRSHRLGRTLHREAMRSTRWTASGGVQRAMRTGGRTGVRPKKNDLPISTRARSTMTIPAGSPRKPTEAGVNPKTVATGVKGRIAPTATVADRPAVNVRPGLLRKKGTRRVRIAKMTRLCVATIRRTSAVWNEVAARERYEAASPRRSGNRRSN